MHAQKGDKVRLRAKGSSGDRGVVEQVEGEHLVVCLQRDHKTVRVPAAAVTNLSLAARKAWLNMPDRNVGRPKGAKTVDRVSVTLRLDRDVWDRFVAEERKGRIRERTKVVNDWFREKLDGMDKGEH